MNFASGDVAGDGNVVAGNGDCNGYASMESSSFAKAIRQSSLQRGRRGEKRRGSRNGKEEVAEEGKGEEEEEHGWKYELVETCFSLFSPPLFKHSALLILF